MIPNMPALGIRFDIAKVDSIDNSEGYGIESWKHFWRIINIKTLNSVFLFEGDTDATPDRENVFCIAIQSVNQSLLSEIKNNFYVNNDFHKVSAVPKFVEGNLVIREPLPDAGKVDSNGNFTPQGYNSKAALEKINLNI